MAESFYVNCIKQNEITVKYYCYAIDHGTTSFTGIYDHDILELDRRQQILYGKTRKSRRSSRRKGFRKQGNHLHC